MKVDVEIVVKVVELEKVIVEICVGVVESI